MTAVEKAIERLKNLNSVILTNTKENRSIKNACVHCIMILKEHLEVEKQQIKDAYVDGFKECEKIHEEVFFIQDLSEQYYNETYKKP